MGSLCGKESKNDNFAGPGRTLGSAPPPKPARASVPARSTAAADSRGTTVAAEQGEARKAAGSAAEERVKKNTGKGKIGRDLDIQKGQTMNQTLEQASKDERRRREIDQMAKDRAHA